jgi:Asp/Glu/hydantoin racemase
MLSVARVVGRGSLDFDGMTAQFGEPLITDEAQLALAATAVVALAPRLGPDLAGVIVSAFGDPGASDLRSLIDVPVVGIGEAALREAAGGARRFCVATTTFALANSIDRRVAQLGLDANYTGVVLTQGDAVAVTSDPARLETELASAIEGAIRRLGIEAVVIGGGPLSEAAKLMQVRFPIAVIEPIAAAVRELLRLIKIDRGQVQE